MTETPQERIERFVREEIALVPYDPSWPEMFRQEQHHLRACLPGDLVGRIEHFGSTAIPGMTAKPIVDMLVEVTDLEATKVRIVPILEGQGYDYFWRPTHGDDGPPFYAWFVKRDRGSAPDPGSVACGAPTGREDTPPRAAPSQARSARLEPVMGRRTHHIHMVEPHFEHWDALLFRDYLIARPDVAREYEQVKRDLAARFPHDRRAYTEGKTAFVLRVTSSAKGFFRASGRASDLT